MNIERPESKVKMGEGAKKVYEGAIFEAYQWPQKLYDGREVTFEKLRRPDTVSVIPVLENGNILLSKEAQPGREESGTAISGRIDVEGEGPLETAKRELLEESGYEAESWKLWKADQVTGKIDWVTYIFITRGLKRVTEQKLDGGEQIELQEVDLDEFITRVTDEAFWGKHIALEVLRLLHREGREGLKRLLFVE